MNNLKRISLDNIKSIEFNDFMCDNDFIILQANEIESVYLDEEEKVYEITNTDGIVFNSKKIRYVR